MNRRSFIRKVIYILCIGLLLIPLSYYSQPASVGAANQAVGAGKLAQLREKYKISEASLGEVDPAGETIKLATLGLRGVAVVMLWEKAKTSQMKEDWDGLQATLDQLTKLEPHFLTFWRHQAWNVSYNISVEWDDYHDRYRWVKEGIKLLLQGRRYNDHEPLLIYDIGWTTAQKMGTADEKVQYRRLFREDDDPEFPNHRLRPQNRRDNWLVGQEYYNEAVRLVEDRDASIHRMNPLVFYSEPAMCQIDYAIALEEDGVFEEKAKVGWMEADEYWTKYGAREMRSTIGIQYRLNDKEELEEKIAETATELEAMAPDLRKTISDERLAKLPAEEREVLEAPPDRRDPWRAFGIMMKLNVNHRDFAERITGPQHDKAIELADEVTRMQQLAELINHEREVVNFAYWRLRCRAEKTDAALEARRLLYVGKGLYENAQFEEARENYENAFSEWRKVVDEFPAMVDDTIGGTSLEEAVKGYVDVLKQLDEPFPKNFPIKDVVAAMLRRSSLPIPPEFLQDAVGTELGNPPAPPIRGLDMKDGGNKEAGEKEAEAKGPDSKEPAGKEPSKDDDKQPEAKSEASKDQAEASKENPAEGQKPEADSAKKPEGDEKAE
ncbi:MAG TPA: hypothetical protein VHC22_11865 [Pirellulales bacterium]|nr:hypothetical protein [Pirellulales bacterium]